jgi:hypothetical protein
MNLGEILDRTFQIYRAKFWAFVGIAAIPALVMMGLHLIESPWLHGPPNIYMTWRGSAAWSFIVSLGFYHVSSLLGLMISPALVYLSSAALLCKPGSIWSAIRFVTARRQSYLWVSVLKVTVELIVPEILVVVLFVGEFLIAVLAGNLNDPRVFGGGLSILVIAFPVMTGLVLFLWIGPCLSLALPAAALEGTLGLKALRRSWGLTKGSRTRILVTWAIIAFFGGILIAVLQLIFRQIFHRYFVGVGTQSLYLPAARFLNAILSSLIGPIFPIALTLFYYDQRIRQEGYDIERMMEAAGMNAPVTPHSGDGLVAPAVTGEGLA